ncbi:MAG: hypothetical protein QOH16_689 [Gaiellaceae bacterium]|nr:hypothetical protein [Gaiellaceae bacterium]
MPITPFRNPRHRLLPEMVAALNSSGDAASDSTQVVLPGVWDQTVGELYELVEARRTSRTFDASRPLDTSNVKTVVTAIVDSCDGAGDGLGFRVYQRAEQGSAWFDWKAGAPRAMTNDDVRPSDVIPGLDPNAEPALVVMIAADLPARARTVESYARALLEAGIAVKTGWLTALTLGLTAAVFAAVDHEQARKLGHESLTSAHLVSLLVGFSASDGPRESRRETPSSP